MFSYTIIIIISTVLVSIAAFNDDALKYKLTFSAYEVKHHKKMGLLFSHAFVHADYMHLFFNMFVLYMFGAKLEVYFHYIEKDYLFILLYCCAIPAACYPALIKHSNNPSYRALGASGAVTAVLFYAILIEPLSSLYIMFLPIPIPGIVFGIIYIASEYYLSKKGTSYVAHDAHISGAIFALIFALLFDSSAYKIFYYQIIYYF